MADDLKTIYNAATENEAELNLTKFEEKWNSTHASVAKIWRRNWDGIIPLFSYSADIRKAIYTTNTIESLNMSCERSPKTATLSPATKPC